MPGSQQVIKNAKRGIMINKDLIFFMLGNCVLGVFLNGTVAHNYNKLVFSWSFIQL